MGKPAVPAYPVQSLFTIYFSFIHYRYLHALCQYMGVCLFGIPFVLPALHRFPPCSQLCPLMQRQSLRFGAPRKPKASGRPTSCIAAVTQIHLFFRQLAQAADTIFPHKIVRTAIYPAVFLVFDAIQDKKASGSAVRIFCGNRLRGYSQFFHKTGAHRCGKRLTPTGCTRTPVQPPTAPPLQTAADPHPDRGSPHR